MHVRSLLRVSVSFCEHGGLVRLGFIGDVVCMD